MTEQDKILNRLLDEKNDYFLSHLRVKAATTAKGL